MRLIIVFCLGMIFTTHVQAQDMRRRVLEKLDQYADFKSQISRPKAAFYESCERMPAKVFGLHPLTGEERQISLVIMRYRGQPNSNPGSRRSVLIVPPSGGVNQLDYTYGEMLCAKGIEAWVITEWDRGVKDYIGLTLDIESHDTVALSHLVALRQIVQHMPGRAGILGTSAGGKLAAVALAVEPRLQAGVLVAAGADLPQILANSNLQTLRELRDLRMQTFNWSFAQYAAELREKVIIDPLWFAADLRAKQVGTVIAFRDRTVPSRNQLLLEEISQAKRITDYNDDHTAAIVKAALSGSWKVIRFFQNHL